MFISFGHFLQVYRKVNEWPILKLHRIKECYMYCVHNCFILFDDRDWQGGVLKLMKSDHFLVFLAVWVVFPKFLGRLRGELC